MINTYFIGDTHFGHKKIIEFETTKPYRNFSSVEEMNECIIDNWNKTVKQKDIVYHLGDFAFGRKNVEIAERLNGRKILILGNHDHYPASDYLKYFDKLYGSFCWKNCILSHIPIHRNCFRENWELNIHGHLHNKKVIGYEHEDYFEDWDYFNVSCEQNNLTPFHSDQIFERLKGI